MDKKDKQYQQSLIPKILELCKAGQYDEAIKMTNDIADKNIAVKAHLLCIEHEQSRSKA